MLLFQGAAIPRRARVTQEVGDLARRRRPPRPGGRPRGRRKRPRQRPRVTAPVVPDTPVARLEEETRNEVAALMDALMTESGLVEGERTLARIIEQHPQFAEAFMGASSHFSSGDRESPFVHVGLHLIVERGVVSRDHEMSKASSDKSWHDAVHERFAKIQAELFGPEQVSEEAS